MRISECLDKVDVVVCTYNSERYLDSCLSSVFRNVPVNRLFVVDNYSTDKTVEVAERYGAEVVRSKGSLAESRKLSFELVTTSLFVNVDSDVVLCEGWFDRVSRFMVEGVGACWGIALTMNPVQHRHYQEAMYSFKSADRYDLIVLGNMLCRREAVEGLRFPRDYCRGAVAGEDYFIKRFIEGKGFRVLSVPVFVEHYCNPPPLGLKTYWGGASTRLSEHRGVFGVLKRVLLSVPQGCFAALRCRDALVVPYWVRYRLEQLYGWLHWDRYYNLRRRG